jgi:citrate lyase alpha subunit
VLINTTIYFIIPSIDDDPIIRTFCVATILTFSSVTMLSLQPTSTIDIQSTEKEVVVTPAPKQNKDKLDDASMEKVYTAESESSGWNCKSVS